ncbi:MAG: hypothetical protein ACFN4S_07490 [Prevotella conceptionensis]
MYRKHARVAIGTESMYACRQPAWAVAGHATYILHHENAEVTCYRQVVFNL